jgi:4-amino-4-deoxy-L-arabinose transferase-like glycosyltransferase
MNKKLFVEFILLGTISLAIIIINSFWVTIQWYAMSSISNEETAFLLLTLSWILFIPLFFSPFLFAISLIGLIFRKIRKISGMITVFLLLFLITGIIAMSISGNIRHKALVQITQNSSELIKAIKNYELSQGNPPEKLEQLVPNFLISVPSTGIGAYPNYKYSRCSSNEDERECFGNSWMLTVETPPGGLNFDRFLYLPDQNYPQEGYGGTLELIENWAYVHE